jgi:hypothetical protein
MLGDRQTKGDPKNLKISLFFSLFSGNLGIIVGRLADDRVAVRLGSSC